MSDFFGQNFYLENQNILRISAYTFIKDFQSPGKISSPETWENSALRNKKFVSSLVLTRDLRYNNALYIGL